jgi:hypothetical protein
MEYIPSGTSQLNGRIERRFPVVWNKAKIYMQIHRKAEKRRRQKNRFILPPEKLRFFFSSPQKRNFD